MKSFFLFLRRQDRNELTYWIGLLMLLCGLWAGCSMTTALMVVGAAMAAESVTTSYVAAWMNNKAERN